MTLADFIPYISQVQGYDRASTEILSVAYDSRLVTEGSLFVAVNGVKQNGQQYIAAAISNGASAIVTSEYIVDCPVAQVVVNDTRLALAQVSRVFYGNPAMKMKLLAVTGTNGKTTTAYVMRHIISECGNNVGMLGTVEYDLGRGNVISSPLTTPQSTDFQRYLAEMLWQQADYAIAEMSSHAIEQKRVLPDDVSCAVFTNLTRDHLDYHGTMENYFSTKKLLFDGLRSGTVAVVNSGDVYSRLIVEHTKAKVVTFGFEKDDDYRICGVDYFNNGTFIELLVNNEAIEINSPLVGEYNVLNLVGALAGVVESGIPVEDAVAGVENFSGVPGRLEHIANPKQIGAFVDYAHTPDALEKVLSVLRPLTKGRLFVVFGCGGDRDKGKRPQMGSVACNVADSVYITSDNPRSEMPEDIIKDILGGCPDAATIVVELDRRKAIELALNEAEAGDIVLVAGKGHEDYQIIGKQKHHFDDREVIRDFSNQKAG